MNSITSCLASSIPATSLILEEEGSSGSDALTADQHVPSAPHFILPSDDSVTMVDLARLMCACSVNNVGDIHR